MSSQIYKAKSTNDSQFVAHIKKTASEADKHIEDCEKHILGRSTSTIRCSIKNISQRD